MKVYIYDFVQRRNHSSRMGTKYGERSSVSLKWGSRGKAPWPETLPPEAADILQIRCEIWRIN